MRLAVPLLDDPTTASGNLQLLMYSRFRIQTRLSMMDAEEALCRLVELSGSPLTVKPFEGRVEQGAFKFHRIIKGRNSFVPIISGRIVEGEAGATIQGTMRLHALAAVS